MRVEKSADTLKNRLSKNGVNRFRMQKNGVIIDTRTGLMWTAADSLDITGECMDYEGAANYIGKLKVGGLSDWRMPTAEELAILYKTKPFFPKTKAPWYWSLDNYLSYGEGVDTRIVDVITAENKTDYEIQSRDAFQCGAVRAVRP